MGNVQENLLTKGFSGKIGDEIVFRQVGNRTLFAKRPRKRSSLTPNQVTHQARFRDAVFFAKTMLLDPVLKEEYQSLARQFNLRSAYNAAVTDFLKEPQIALVYTDNYKVRWAMCSSSQRWMISKSKWQQLHLCVPTIQ
jgi:hypothetical protein